MRSCKSMGCLVWGNRTQLENIESGNNYYIKSDKETKENASWTWEEILVQMLATIHQHSGELFNHRKCYPVYSCFSLFQAALSQLWGIGSSRIALSFGRIFGCLLIFVSVCCTMYIGPDKEMEWKIQFLLIC